MKIFRLFVAFTLICFALSPRAQAVVPAPDGAYPNFTTAEGQNALHSLTTGAANTALGAFSLFGNTTGSFNTAVGALALDLNTGDQNTAVGVAALLLNTGANNTAVGVDALGLNSTGVDNTADGAFALYSNTVGFENTATGFQALQSNITGNASTAEGYQALNSNTTGGANTAIGDEALFSNTTGSNNTGIGNLALANNTTGGTNIALGNNSGSGVITANNVICIGGVTGADTSDTCFIGNIRNVTTGANNAIPVLIDSNNQLGTLSSSRRFKKEIKRMDKASEAILAFKPVTFHYKSDKTNRPEFGLIAEDVAEVNPDLVIYDRDGKPYTVRYEAVNAMLLNEFLKEHRKVEQQWKDFEAAIAQQQKQIEALTATVTEQAAQIQKVSAQLEVSKPAPQTVLNNQ
jgi:hypothetical protein